MNKKAIFTCFIAGGLLPAQLVTAQVKAPFSTKNKNVKVIVSDNEAGVKFKNTETLKFTDSPQPGETEVSVFVDPAKSFQTMLGIGGALTDAAAETFYKLPKDKQKELLAAYFDKEKGIGYTLGRT